MPNLFLLFGDRQINRLKINTDSMAFFKQLMGTIKITVINVPIKNIQGEYMVLRPQSVLAIRVEPVFLGSVERF